MADFFPTNLFTKMYILYLYKVKLEISWFYKAVIFIFIYVSIFSGRNNGSKVALLLYYLDSKSHQLNSLKISAFS